MLTLPVELTHREARACQQQLAQGLSAVSAGDIVVDASAVRRFDSAALAVLLDFGRLCQQQGRHCAVQGLPAGLQRLARVYGVQGLLQLA